MPAPLAHRSRPVGLALAALLAVACEREPPLPPPRPRAPRTESPAAAVPSDAAPAAPEPPAPEPEPPPLNDSDLAPPAAAPLGPPQQPDGVPFPLPDPLPPECRPHAASASATGLREGPPPLQGWLGGTGAGEGEFTYPRALAAAPDGALYVVDKTGRIQKFDRDGRLLAWARTPAIDQGKPTCLSIAPDGDLLVADTHYCRVLVYSPDLVLRRAFGAPGRAPGQFLLLTGAIQARDGRYYTTDYGDYEARLQVFARDGTPLACTGTFGTEAGQLRRPMSLCVDEAHDAVFVADAVNHRIAVFGRDGSWRATLSGPEELRFPYSIVQDERGRLWVAEFGGHRVTVLDRETGAVLGRWGQPGRALGSLSSPWGVAPGPADRVWLLDSGNDRVYALPRGAILGTGEPG